MEGDATLRAEADRASRDADEARMKVERLQAELKQVRKRLGKARIIPKPYERGASGLTAFSIEFTMAVRKWSDRPSINDDQSSVGMMSIAQHALRHATRLHA